MQQEICRYELIVLVEAEIVREKEDKRKEAGAKEGAKNVEAVD